MARQLWDGRLYGREGFDQHAGIEWQFGPNLQGVNGLTPDIPWALYKEGHKIYWDNGAWAVTAVGLEPFYASKRERYEQFEISKSNLLSIHASGQVYAWPIAVAENNWLELEAFEEAFNKAIELHNCKPDEKTLVVSFRRARGLRRKARKAQMLQRGKSASHRAKRGL